VCLLRMYAAQRARGVTATGCLCARAVQHFKRGDCGVNVTAVAPWRRQLLSDRKAF
jgi:hypothetical protein